MAKSQVKKIGEEVRPSMEAKNEYQESSFEYNSSSPNLLSPIGKDTIGSADDIKARTSQLVKNKYGNGAEYFVED
jgi:hypothetical protein